MTLRAWWWPAALTLALILNLAAEDLGSLLAGPDPHRYDGIPRRTAPVSPFVLGQRGQVELLRRPEEGWRPLRREIPLQRGYRVRTGPAGYVDVVLGGRAWVHLGADAELGLARLGESTGPEDPAVVELALEQGALMSRVSGPRKWADFRVSTPVAVAAVRGTVYEVRFDGGTMTVRVLEGQVAVTDKDGQGEVLVSAGEGLDWTATGAGSGGTGGLGGTGSGGVDAGGSGGTATGTGAGSSAGQAGAGTGGAGTTWMLSDAERGQLAAGAYPAWFDAVAGATAGDGEASGAEDATGPEAAGLDADPDPARAAAEIGQIVETCRLYIEQGSAGACAGFCMPGATVSGYSPAAAQLLIAEKMEGFESASLAVTGLSVMVQGRVAQAVVAVQGKARTADGAEVTSSRSGTLKFVYSDGRWLLESGEAY